MANIQNIGITIEDQSQEKLNTYVSSFESSFKFQYPSTSACAGSSYKVTLKRGTYYIECYGGKGGGPRSGKGGSASGILPISQEKTLYLFIGSQGSNATCNPYGGGGLGGTYSGGGSTDIRLINSEGDDGLRSRIIVAGGGAGSNTWLYGNAMSGSGGGIKGEDGNEGYKSDYQAPKVFAATQTLGGFPVLGAFTETGSNGTFFYGANSSGKSSYTGGGGGGYYGGGSSNDGKDSVSGASGGSSFVSGMKGCNAVNQDGTHRNNPAHYSGIRFKMPTTDTGVNDGDGFIIVKRIGDFFQWSCRIKNKDNAITPYIILLMTCS